MLHQQQQKPPTSAGDSTSSVANSSAPSSSSRKLAIKNLSLVGSSTIDYSSEWSKLKEAVDAVYQSTSVQYTLEDLLKAVETVCNHYLADTLYKDLQMVFDQFVQSNLHKFLTDSPDTVSYLRTLASFWDNYCCQILMIRCIFLFLDRQHVLFNPEMRSLWDLGLNTFSRRILDNREVQRRCIGGLLELIELERGGDAVDRQLLRTLLRMLFDLGQYRTVIEGQQRLAALEVADYLSHVETRLAEENDRLSHYLNQCSRTQLFAVLLQQLITAHLPVIIERGLRPLIVPTVRRDDLSRLYGLLARIEGGHSQLCDAFKSLIKQEGCSIVQNPSCDPEKDRAMVQHLLDFKDKVDEIQANCFDSNEKFQHAIVHSFEAACNCRPNKPAEYIAKYIDSKLKSGNKAASDEELERLLDKIMVLFRFVQGKDVFEAFYKKDLAKRLLIGRSASSDAEKSMLSKLKQECGAGYTNKLEGMFKDIELSHDINSAFRQHLAQQPQPPSIDMSVNVLTMGFWPTYQPGEVRLPPEMISLQELFRRFYLGKHTGRRLLFQHSLGCCNLKAQFSGGQRKELLVSEFQTLVLLLFNDSDSLTLIEIADRNRHRGERAEADPAEPRVLIKNPSSKDVLPTDTFQYNAEFRHKLIKVKFNQLQLKETDKEQKLTEERVFAGPSKLTQAIVRIMKMRKTLEHNPLIAELLEQLKFPCKASDLKKRIESLIDRDYIRRDSDKQNLYHYVA
uniref:CULLIN_2 domain-containing protein n=1 Tax=Macrostomum lignano TaxID=282301 RepID=A0A1I8G3G5_9PLAT